MELDAKCPPSCKNRKATGIDVQPHTIVAMVGAKVARVKCNICEAEHAYRAPPTASEATAKKRRAERKAALSTIDIETPTADEYESLAKDKDLKAAVAYNIKVALQRDDVIKHPKFGTGIVVALKEGNKATVAFPDGGRTLVHSRE